MTPHPTNDENINQREEPTEAEPHGVTCPFCHSTDTERFALFGSRLSTDHYVCRACHTAFERIRHTAQ